MVRVVDHLLVTEQLYAMLVLLELDEVFHLFEVAWIVLRCQIVIRAQVYEVLAPKETSEHEHRVLAIDKVLHSL